MSANATSNSASKIIQPRLLPDSLLNYSETLRALSSHDYSAIDRWRTRSSELNQPGKFIEAIRRRYLRECRRRAVGRAYDMALEIARYVAYGSEVLDVGCGNGLIAHHLSAILGAQVVGIDVSEQTIGPITYQQYDGAHFPAPDKSFDAVLLCYVLHHAQDIRTVLSEVGRVLRDRGRGIVYEDLPKSLFDRGVCWSHNLQWRHRTGPCSFHVDAEWQDLFQASGLEVVTARNLSRWRNLAHPVARRLYVLERAPSLLVL